MGFFGFGGNSAQHERAQRRGEQAWEELQETREEVQEAVQEKLGHVKHKVDEQAQGVKEQAGHLKDKVVGAGERGQQHAAEASDRLANASGRAKWNAERGAHALAERSANTADRVRDSARDTKEAARDRAGRAEDAVEEQSQRAKHAAKGKWREGKERADRTADEAAHKTRSNIHGAQAAVGGKAEEAKRAIGHRAEQARDALHSGSQRVKGSLQGAAEQSKERAGEVKGKAEETGRWVKDGMEERTEDVKEGAARARDTAARNAEGTKKAGSKPFWWLGRKADEGTDKVAEGAGAVKGSVRGAAHDGKEAGKGLGAKLDRATDKMSEGAGYAAGYVEETAERAAKGTKHALGKAVDVLENDVNVTVKRVETPFISIHSKTVKELLAGGLAGAIAQSSATPLEVVRTKLLGGRSGENVKDVVRSLNRQKGRDWPIKQTSGSFGTNVLRVALTKSVELVTYEKVKAKLKRRGRPGDHQIPGLDKLPRQIPESTWAGAMAGVASTLVAYPFEVLKDRVVIMPEKYTGFGQAFREVLFREGGVPALYRGAVPALLGMIPQSAINYYTYDHLKERYRKKTGRKNVPALYTLAFGATAGAISQLATYPLEVARKQVSVSVLPAVETSKAANAAYANVAEAVRGILRAEGVGGLYKGVGAQVAQVIPVAGLSWVVFESARRALNAEEEDEG